MWNFRKKYPLRYNNTKCHRIKVRRQGMARKNQHKDHRIDQKLQFRQFNARNKKALSLKKFEISRTEI